VQAFQLFQALTLVFYAGAFIAYLFFFINGGPVSRRLVSPSLIATIFVHLIYLFTISLADGHVPLTNVGEATSTVVFSIAVLYYIIQLSTKEMNLGVFVLAVCLLLQGISSITLREVGQVSPLLEQGGYAFHAVANVLGYSGFFLGFIFSGLYLMQRRQIKRHTPGWVFSRLPSLGALDTMSLHSIMLGFFLFSIGLVAAALWGKQVWGVYFKLEIKIVLAAICWILYGGYLALRLVPGWTRKYAAYLSTVAFTLLLLAFLASPVLSPSHAF
jgi:ABC-type transport system involved in cytochrome c biogenesis permease subunit